MISQGFSQLCSERKGIVILGLMASLFAGGLLTLGDPAPQFATVRMICGGLCLFALVLLIIAPILAQLGEDVALQLPTDNVHKNQAQNQIRANQKGPISKDYRPQTGAGSPVVGAADRWEASVMEVRAIAAENPRLAAQILKSWIAADD